MVKILIIDDELPVCDSLKQFFTLKKYQVFIATSVEEGLAVAKQEQPNVIFLDIMMPGRSGIEVLKRVKEINDKAKVIMLTGISDEKVIEQAKEHGADDYVTKPFSLDHLENEVMPRILRSLI